MTSRWQKYKEKNGTTPLDLLNPATKRIPEELSEARLRVCKECPELIPVVNQCKKCGCFMNLKTKFEASKCPIGKW